MRTSFSGNNTHIVRPVFRRPYDHHIISMHMCGLQCVHEHHLPRFQGNTVPPLAALLGSDFIWTIFSQPRLTFCVMYYVFMYRLISCYLSRMIIFIAPELVGNFGQRAFLCSVYIIAVIKLNKCSVVQLTRAGSLPCVLPLSEWSRPIFGPAPDGGIDDDVGPHLSRLARSYVSHLISCPFSALLGLVRVGVVCLVDRWSYGVQTAEPP